jgi:hypothetical protein
MGEITPVDIYKEQYSHFRSMNDILYKIPPIFTAVLGGLWYFAITILEKDKWIACVVFAFALVASLCFINVMQRFRMAFNAYITNLNKMDMDMAVTTKPTSFPPSTLSTVQIMLAAAALVSLAGAIYAANK